VTVAPSHAASLVMIRPDGAVLLGRRLKTAAFIPDAFVFPGGRVDPADLTASTPLLPESEIARMAACGATRAMPAHALAAAAMRETLEETGLRPGGPLRFLGRAITPRQSPIRFHARFFWCEGEAEGDLAGSGELVDLGWYPFAEAGKLPMIDVTAFMLAEAEARVRGADQEPALFCYRHGRPQIRRSPA